MRRIPYLIVWADITWLFMAVLCLHYDLPFVIIEQHKQEIDHKDETVILQPRTMRQLSILWLDDAIRDISTPCDQFGFFRDKQSIGNINRSIDYPWIDSPLLCKKADLAWIFHSLMNEHNKSVKYGVSFVDYKYRDSALACTIELWSGKKDVFQVGHLIGCDGEHSIVKKAAHLHHQAVAIYSHIDIKPTNNADHTNNVWEWESPSLSYVIMPQQKQQHLYETPKNTKKYIFLLGKSAYNHSFFMSQTLNQWLLDAINLVWKFALIDNNTLTPRLIKTFATERWAVHHTLLEQEKKLIQRIMWSWIGKLLGTDQLKQSLSNTFFRKNITQLFSGYAVGYTQETSFRDNVYPSLFNQLFKKSPWWITRKDWLRFARWPKAGVAAPLGHVVIRSNEPKERLATLFNEQWYTLLFFLGVNDNTFLEQVKKHKTRFDNLIGNVSTSYIVTSTYDISSFDGTDYIVWDPDHQLHDQYSVRTPWLYVVRPDGVIAWRSLWYLVDELIEYFDTIMTKNLKQEKTENDATQWS